MSAAPGEGRGVGVIRRVQWVRIENFRGFKCPRPDPQPLDLDADLVLITGPNGYGKTSLLEALLLLLTGYGEADPVRDLIARRPRGVGEEASEPAARCALHARAVSIAPEDGTERAQELKLEWGRGHAGPLPMPEGAWSRFPAPAPDEANPAADRELDARLCAFFQDRIPRLFDQAARGKTLRDVFEPLPKLVHRLLELLPALPEDLQDEAKSERYAAEWPHTGEKAPEALRRSLAAAWQVLRPLLRELLMGRSPLPEAAALPPDVADDGALDGVARAVAKALGAPAAEALRYAELRRRFRAAVEAELEAQVETAKREAAGATELTAELQAALDEVNRKLAAIDREYPHLERDVAALDAGEPGLPDALAVFRALAANAARWGRLRIPESEEEGPPHFRRALFELAQVEETEAGECADAIGAWLDVRRRALEDRRALEKHRSELERTLKASLSSARLEALNALRAPLSRALEELESAWAANHEYTQFRQNKEGRDRAKDLLDAATEAAKWCRAALEKLSEPDPALMKAVRDRADLVLRRFSLVEGVLPLCLEPYDEPAGSGGTLRRGYGIQTGDGRELAHLSTGQRAQVAVSLLVATNLMVSQKLSHRVILLDDVTTAYDLANLSREAILWRQLAYGAEDDQRRQVFISSHHEDMTSHLLDLLVPPEGRRMRLVRFTGWSLESGPEYDVFEVDPSVGTDTQLAEGLKYF